MLQCTMLSWLLTDELVSFWFDMLVQSILSFVWRVGMQCLNESRVVYDGAPPQHNGNVSLQ